MLTPAELLDFEAAWPLPLRGEKELAIERTLGLRPARYYQLLHRAAGSLEGQAHDAITAHRVLNILATARGSRDMGVPVGSTATWHIYR